jgi:hypothetical protein
MFEIQKPINPKKKISICNNRIMFTTAAIYKQIINIAKRGFGKKDPTVNNLRKLFVVIHRNNNRFRNKSVPLSALIDISQSVVI